MGITVIDRNPLPSKRPIFCITHGSCSDGFFAAWVVRYYAKQTGQQFTLHEAHYNEPLPEIPADSEVVITDFSYSRETLLALNDKVASLVVLDHHETARKNLDDLGFAVFDTNRSGCGLAWDYFFPKRMRPWFINYAEDRDLWRHALINTREINMYLAHTAKNFEIYDAEIVMPRLQTTAISYGSVLCEQFDRIAAGIKNKAYVGNFDGHKCMVVSCPHYFASDVGSQLATHFGLAVMFETTSIGTYKYSLRSDDRVDVSILAEKYGGGGHKKAAGFYQTKLLEL